MSVKKTQAQQLLDNPLLVELFAQHERAIYEQWLAEREIGDQQAQRAKARALRDIRAYITNKCEGIINGHE